MKTSGKMDTTGPVSAVVVCGGGLTENGETAAWGEERCRLGAELYRLKRNSGTKCVVVTTSAGTTHKPMPRDPVSGFQVTESQAYAKTLLGFGVDPRDVLEEALSFDTIGNAFFVRLLHLDPLGIRDVTVVTSAFHMPRTEAIFRKVSALEPRGTPFHLTFAACADVGISPESLQARKQKEATSLVQFQENSVKFETIAAFHSFLFQDHLAYATKRLTVKSSEPEKTDLLKTY